MVIEISVAIIAFVLVVWLTILSITVIKIRKTLEKAAKDFQNVTSEVSKLIEKVDNLLSDIQSKANSLDALFRPFRKGRFVHEASETVSEVIELVTSGVALFNKFRNSGKRREK